MADTPARAHRDSDPPVSRRGVSWKVVGATVGLVLAAVMPTSTILMEAGALRQQLTDMRAEVNSLIDREATTREDVAVLKTRVDHIEQDVNELKRDRAHH